MNSTLTGIPVLGSVFAPVASLLDSVGLNDPAKLAGNAPLTDQQKETLKKLETALKTVANKVESELPVSPPVSFPVRRSGTSVFKLYSVFVLTVL